MRTFNVRQGTAGGSLSGSERYGDAYAGLGNRPAYALLVQFPAVCFVATLVTDVIYWRTEEFMWETFSIWLLTAGCLTAALAGIVGLVTWLRDGRVRAAPLAWPHAVTSLAALVLSVFNAFIHSRDGYTAVVPTGLTLSAIVVLLMLVVTWMGWRNAQQTTLTGEPT